VQPGGNLLCAIDADDRAPSLIAAARAWAAATRCDALFVDARPGSEPEPAIAATVDHVKPSLVLVGSPGWQAGGAGLAGVLLRDGVSPLVIVPPVADGASADKPIVCGVSLGDHDEVAVRFAHGLARITGRRLAARAILGSRDVASFAAARARSSIAVPMTLSDAQADATARTEVLAERLLDVTRDADAGALVIASRPGDPVSRALATDELWAAAGCAVIVVRP